MMKHNSLIVKSLCAWTVALIITLLTGCSKKEPENSYFLKAEPVWPAGRTLEKNLTIRFQAAFARPADGQAVLNITGSTLYRIYLNGEFAGHGPARAGHGWYRVDEWDLSGLITEGTNQLEIQVAGYNVNSYYLLDQPSFLQAEVVSDGKVLATTSVRGNDFVATVMEERVQKVPRYSFQRPFIEVYRIGQEGKKAGRQKESGKEKGGKEIRMELEHAGHKNLIERRIPYPAFDIRYPLAEVAHGTFEPGVKRETYWKDRSVVNIGPKLGGFTEPELELNPSIDLQEMEVKELKKDSAEYSNTVSIPLDVRSFRVFDFGTNLTGFIGAELEVTRAGKFYFTFDEILTRGDVDFKRLGTIAAVLYELEPGTYPLESFEPYTFRYLKIIALNGECDIRGVYLRDYANPDTDRAAFECSDPRLNRIFKAGVETFRQNAVDVFMDCPHRERAGWLCDSYFTARVANDVSGNTLVERNFLENFALPDSFAHLPKGMLPMCYPSDHNDSVFIPNWAMWFVVELREYLGRSNDRQLVDRLQPRVLALLDYFKPFENEDGLLEKLDSWIFVEWSAANNFVQDVNYPTNMLYAATLEAAGDLYGIDSLKNQADQIRATIREQSWNGEFFIDNATVGEDPRVLPSSDNPRVLIPTNNISEVCQYFAFYFGVATPETYPELWRKLATQFGPGRKDNNPYPNVHFANSFVGNYLRLELLSRYNLQAQLLAESIGYFDYMAMKTGTLWENITDYASCNHGFASHVVHVFYRDVLGIAEVDPVNKRVRIKIADLPLTSCTGTMPAGDQQVALGWSRTGNTVTWHCNVPEGYQMTIEGAPALTLVKN